MNAAIVVLATMSLGIDVGWQSGPKGEFEYIVQLEPETMQTLADGDDVFSRLPPSLRGVRRCRITVGRAELPHEGTPPPADAADTTATLPNEPGVDTGWQPIAGGGVEYMIQIEPRLAERLAAGHDVIAYLPPHSRNVRGFRITVGAGTLPHQGEAPPSDAAAPHSPETPPAAADPEKTTPAPTDTASVPAAETERTKIDAPPPPDEGEGGMPGPSLGDPTKQSPIQQAAATSPAKEVSAKKTPVPDDANAGAGTSDAKNPDDKSMADQSQHAWTPLIATTVALFASLGGNAFLILLASAQRKRYRELSARLSTRAAASAT